MWSQNIYSIVLTLFLRMWGDKMPIDEMKWVERYKHRDTAWGYFWLSDHTSKGTSPPQRLTKDNGGTVPNSQIICLINYVGGWRGKKRRNDRTSQIFHFLFKLNLGMQAQAQAPRDVFSKHLRNDSVICGCTAGYLPGQKENPDLIKLIFSN